MKNTPSRIHAAAEEIRKQGVSRAGAKPNTECGESRSEAEDSSRREQERSRKQGAASAGAKPKTGRSESRGRKGAARADERLHSLIYYGKIWPIFFVAKPKKFARFTARCCLFDGKLGRAAKPPKMPTVSLVGTKMPLEV